MLPLPLFHVYANVGVQGLALVTGNPLALVPNPRDLADLLATIRRVKPAFFNGVPTLYVALLNHPDVQRGKVDFKSIKICFSGAAALMADTKKRFETLTGGRIVEGYSLTEAMMALCVNPVNGPNKIGSVGMPLPDVHVRIFDADEGTQEMPLGEVGEICFSAPQLMIGFWNRPEETATVLRDHIEDGVTRRWLHTGDLGYLDEDGYLFIVDRKKDLIKTSGYQVWPREIEETLAAHPAVAEVGVAGIADDTKGEVVRAWVVLRAGQAVTEADLRTYCRGQAGAVQGAGARRVPHRAAEDDGRQGAAAGAQRERSFRFRRNRVNATVASASTRTPIAPRWSHLSLVALRPFQSSTTTTSGATGSAALPTHRPSCSAHSRRGAPRPDGLLPGARVTPRSIGRLAGTGGTAHRNVSRSSGWFGA